MKKKTQYADINEEELIKNGFTKDSGFGENLFVKFSNFKIGYITRVDFPNTYSGIERVRLNLECVNLGIIFKEDFFINSFKEKDTEFKVRFILENLCYFSETFKKVLFPVLDEDTKLCLKLKGVNIDEI